MWLFGIARSTLLNYARGERRRGALFERLRGAMQLRTPLAGADEGADVRDAVARLGADLAEIVRLVHWDGFTMPEVAELLGFPVSTVRSRYRRAREMLRDALEVEVEVDGESAHRLIDQAAPAATVISQTSISPPTSTTPVAAAGAHQLGRPRRPRA